MITFSQKVITFPQEVTIHLRLVIIFPKINFYPKIFGLTRFVINLESHLVTFCRQIHQSAKIGVRGGDGGVQANLGNARILRAFVAVTPP